MLGLTATQNRLPMQERLYSSSNYHALWALAFGRALPRDTQAPENEKRNETRVENPSNPSHDACPATGRHALLSSPTCLTSLLLRSYKRVLLRPVPVCSFTSAFFRETLVRSCIASRFQSRRHSPHPLVQGPIEDELCWEAGLHGQRGLFLPLGWPCGGAHPVLQGNRAC